MNNLMSDILVPGQVIQLPLAAGDSTNQRKIDINQITKEGTVQLGGSGATRDLVKANPLVDKNTNK